MSQLLDCPGIVIGKLDHMLAQGPRLVSQAGPAALESSLRRRTGRSSASSFLKLVISCWASGPVTFMGSQDCMCSAMICAVYLVLEVLSNVLPSCLARIWKIRSKSIPWFRSCGSSSVENATAAISLVGIKYSSRPWASSQAMVVGLSVEKGRHQQRQGSHPSMSSRWVNAENLITRRNVIPLIFWLSQSALSPCQCS